MPLICTNALVPAFLSQPGSREECTLPQSHSSVSRHHEEASNEPQPIQIVPLATMWNACRPARPVTIAMSWIVYLSGDDLRPVRKCVAHFILDKLLLSSDYCDSHHPRQLPLQQSYSFLHDRSYYFCDGCSQSQAQLPNPADEQRA